MHKPEKFVHFFPYPENSPYLCSTKCPYALLYTRAVPFSPHRGDDFLEGNSKMFFFNSLIVK